MDSCFLKNTVKCEWSFFGLACIRSVICARLLSYRRGACAASPSPPAPGLFLLLSIFVPPPPTRQPLFCDLLPWHRCRPHTCQRSGRPLALVPECIPLRGPQFTVNNDLIFSLCVVILPISCLVSCICGCLDAVLGSVPHLCRFIYFLM